MRIHALLIGLAAALFATGANAGDLFNMQPAPAYDPSGFNFDGFYLGAQGGGMVGNLHAGSIGVVAGANFSVTDAVMAGIEFQGDALIYDTTTYDFYALGRVGVMATSDFLAYAEAGPGWSDGVAGYAFGGGGEYALSDMLSLKGEVLGVGAWGGGAQAAKLQAGLLFHLQ